MKGKKPLCALLIVILTFSITIVFVGADPQLPKLFVNPPTYTATQPGEVFAIDVKIANITGLYGFEFKLDYNTTILDAVNCVPLVAYSFLWPLDPETGKWTPINDTLGRIYLIVMMPSFPLSGDHALVRIIFKATYAGSASCILHLYDTILKDINGNPILHDVEDGNYEFMVLSVTVETSKWSYLPGENVEIQGNLTLNSLPHQGLVALEVDNPKNPIVVRTVQIGPTPLSEEISILGVVPCDMWGTPKVPPTYKRNVNQTQDFFYVKVTVKNNDPTEGTTVAITANIYDVNVVPIGVDYSQMSPLGPGSTWSAIMSLNIPEWASLGNATVYANALTEWPGRGFSGARARGVPYCPEKNATFEITDGGLGGASGGQVSGENTGNYSLTFKLPIATITGIYRVYVNAFYTGQFAKSRTLFGVNAIRVPDHYPTIQEAVDAATPTNNSILVFPGTYNEHVTINKSLTLVGIDPSNTLINGNGTGTVVTVAADNVEISRFTIQNSDSSFPASGITLNNSSNTVISENTILNNYHSIYLTNSSQKNTIWDNTITLNSGYGISINSSDNNKISDNTLLSNNYGIHLNHSTSITLTNNNMVCNKYNFAVFGDSLSDFNHTIDESNTVDGKPIVYWVSQYGREVPSYAGFVAIVGSAKIAVRGLNLKKNGQGVLFAFTINSLIERVNTTSNEYGIYLVNSYSNTIIGSNVSNNTVGIYQSYSSENIICHNNLVNNTNQVDIYQSSNTWNDSGGKGNYWSDYNGTDLDFPPDGVGDEYLPWQGVDYHPLMNPWTPMHDVAITNVTLVLPYNASNLYPSCVINVTATVKNEGDFTEFFPIFAFYNESSIGTIYISELTPQAETATDFTWDTTDVSPGNYTISVNASVVLGETLADQADNTCDDGNVTLLAPTVHDVAIASVTPLPTVLYIGLLVTVTVVAKNEGHFTETFNVTAYYDNTTISTQTVTLTPLANTTLTFDWNVTGILKGNYTISANATVVSNETDTADNTFIDGIVQVKLLGDVDGDGRVFASDMVLILTNFGKSSEEFPQGDVDGDGRVFASDMVIVLINFGAGG